MEGKLYIGPAGWSYRDWYGTVYPHERGTSFDPLEYISRYFDLVEVNSTFYRTPAPHQSSSWPQRVSGNPDFLFTVKAPQEFTHTTEPIAARAVTAFTKAVDPIERAGRLGFILIQFPWSFRFDPRARKRIRDIASALLPLPLAVEVRHGSWASRDAIAFLAEMNLSMCSIDQPQIGNSLSPESFRPSAAGAYFRLHGRNAAEWFRPGTDRDLRYNYLYSIEEVDGWSKRIRQTIEEVRRVFVILNNHFRGQAVANGLELKAMLAGKPVRVPRATLATYPRLGRIAVSEDRATGYEKSPLQHSLFGDEEEDEKKKK